MQKFLVIGCSSIINGVVFSFMSAVHLCCRAAHPALASLHKPITVAEYYVWRKVNKKLIKTGRKVVERLVLCVKLIHV